MTGSFQMTKDSQNQHQKQLQKQQLRLTRFLARIPEATITSFDGAGGDKIMLSSAEGTVKPILITRETLDRAL